MPPAAEAVPQPGYAANAPRPRVGFSVDVPDHWTVLDLDPNTQRRWVDAFLDQRLAARPQPPQARQGARRALLDVLGRLNQAKVFLAAILAGEVDGTLVSASATLAWHRPDPTGGIPSLRALSEVYAREPAKADENTGARRVQVVSLPAGGAVKVSTRETVELPTGLRVDGVAMFQYVVPVLATGWLALLTTTTGVPGLAGGVSEVADAMAASLHFEPMAPAPS
jgi:hypothetical protein